MAAAGAGPSSLVSLSSTSMVRGEWDSALGEYGLAASMILCSSVAVPPALSQSETSPLGSRSGSSITLTTAARFTRSAATWAGVVASGFVVVDEDSDLGSGEHRRIAPLSTCRRPSGW